MINRIVVPEAEELIGKYFPVLDHGFVSLVEYMGSDDLIDRAARVSYGMGIRKRSESRRLIRRLVRDLHTSPQEMVEFVFHIGVPIFVMRQWVRHRTSSMNECSGRYSIMPLLFYTPKPSRMAKQSKTNKQGSGDLLSQEEFKYWSISQGMTRHAVKQQYEEALNFDVARELARIDLPLSTYTYAYWKMDLKNLLHFLRLRHDTHAQEEIRDYAKIMCGMVQRVCPITFEAFSDYVLGSVSFTQAEMAGIRYLSHLGVPPDSWSTMDDYEHDKESVNRTLKNLGLVQSERDAFWKKLIPVVIPEFKLDLSNSHPFEYYEKLIKDNAYEKDQVAEVAEPTEQG